LADKFYSIALGDQVPSQVTEGGSSSSEVVELRISDAAYGYGKVFIHNALTTLQAYLDTKETNPIA
jgi:hypothetical protein